MSRMTAHQASCLHESNKCLPIVFPIFDISLAIPHCSRTVVRHRWLRFGWTMLIALAVWIADFTCCAYFVFQTQYIGVFIAHYILILIGPPLCASVETFILGRLLAYLPYHAPMHPGGPGFKLPAHVSCLAPSSRHCCQLLVVRRVSLA